MLLLWGLMVNRLCRLLYRVGHRSARSSFRLFYVRLGRNVSGVTVSVLVTNIVSGCRV